MNGERENGKGGRADFYFFQAGRRRRRGLRSLYEWRRPASGLWIIMELG